MQLTDPQKDNVRSKISITSSSLTLNCSPNGLVSNMTSAPEHNNTPQTVWKKTFQSNPGKSVKVLLAILSRILTAWHNPNLFHLLPVKKHG